jgi:hypothetical protein
MAIKTLGKTLKISLGLLGLAETTIFQLYHGGQFLILVEETRVPGESHRTIPQVIDKLYHIMLY